MKNAKLTVRVSAQIRRELETVARQGKRSLSALAAQLIEQGMVTYRRRVDAPTRQVRSLAGIFKGAVVPTDEDFREVRRELSASLLRRVRKLEDALRR